MISYWNERVRLEKLGANCNLVLRRVMAESISFFPYGTSHLVPWFELTLYRDGWHKLSRHTEHDERVLFEDRYLPGYARERGTLVWDDHEIIRVIRELTVQLDDKIYHPLDILEREHQWFAGKHYFKDYTQEQLDFRDEESMDLLNCALVTLGIEACELGEPLTGGS